MKFQFFSDTQDDEVRVKKLIRFWSALGLVVLLVGCGPLVSGTKIIQADIRLSEAETAGAKMSALYEYTIAEEYLKKSREEHAYSEFWTSRRYADYAILFSEKARTKAELASKTEQVGTSEAN